MAAAVQLTIEQVYAIYRRFDAAYERWLDARERMLCWQELPKKEKP